MNEHVIDRLSPYLDGALGAADLERVEAHLEACASCRRTYRELETLQGLVRALPDPEPPPGLADRLHWRLRREAAGLRRPAPLWWFSVRPPFRVALACATLLVVLGVPAAWMANRFAPPKTPLDTDAYVREYLMLSVDRPLGDEAAPPFVLSDTPASESPRR